MNRRNIKQRATTSREKKNIFPRVMRFRSARVEKLNFEETSRSSFDRLKRFYDLLGLYGQR